MGEQKETEKKAVEGVNLNGGLCLNEYIEIVKTLKEMTAVQCSDGNWNYDQYMHGMANGMIFALSLFQGKRPEYMEAPEKWLESMPNTDKPQAVEAEA